MACEWLLQNPGEMVLGVEDFKGNVGTRVDSFKGVYGKKSNRQKKCREKKIA